MKLRQAKKILQGRRKYAHQQGKWMYIPAFMVARRDTAKRCCKTLLRCPDEFVKLRWFADVFLRVRKHAMESNHELAS